MSPPTTLFAFAFLIPVASAHAQATRPSSRARPVAPQPTAFEALRGTPFNPNGYFFSVSPDEAWIVVVGPDRSHGTTLQVLHRSSAKTWHAPIADMPFEDFPDCFTDDGRRIVLFGEAAELSPSMDALAFRALPRGETPTRTFLGYPKRLLGGHGRPRRGWLGIPQAEGEFGDVAWSDDGVRYTSLADDGANSRLCIEPPGRDHVIDYSAVLDAERDLVAAAAAELPPEFAAVLQRDLDTPATLRLAQLSVSPDGKCLAAIATLFRGSVGFAGRPYGVLIPLDRGKHTARPFAKNVYGKILWSSDAKALYYYAQPQAGTGNGTVHRLEVAAAPSGNEE